MGGHFFRRGRWHVAGVLVLSISLAGFALGQQLGHPRGQPAKQVAAQQAANIAGDIGTRTVTTTPPTPTTPQRSGTPTRVPPPPAPTAPTAPKVSPPTHPAVRHLKPIPPQPAPAHTVTTHADGPTQVTIVPTTLQQPAAESDDAGDGSPPKASEPSSNTLETGGLVPGHADSDPSHTETVGKQPEHAGR
ncbi:MAG: hypothetical protein ACRDHP_18305 [Ktedonobacterales bacterium]